MGLTDKAIIALCILALCLLFYLQHVKAKAYGYYQNNSRKHKARKGSEKQQHRY